MAAKGLAQQVFHLRVDRPETIRGTRLDLIPQLGIDAQRKPLAARLVSATLHVSARSRTSVAEVAVPGQIRSRSL